MQMPCPFSHLREGGEVVLSLLALFMAAWLNGICIGLVIAERHRRAGLEKEDGDG